MHPSSPRFVDSPELPSLELRLLVVSQALEIHSGRGPEIMENILDSAVEACRDSFPRPGQGFRAILER